MSSNLSVTRTPIRDIVSGQGPVTVSGLSEREVANMLAPFSSLSSGVFYPVMKLGQALWTAVGIKNNQKIEKSYFPPARYETVVLACFLALRQIGLEIIALYDTPHGAVLEAKMPTDFFSLGGSLVLDIADETPSKIRVQGATEVKGQLYDWGKGARILQQVCESAEQYMHRMGA